MAEPRDQGDKAIETKAPEKQSENMVDTIVDGIKGAAEDAVKLATDRKSGKYFSGLRAAFGPRPEFFDSSKGEKAEDKGTEGKQDTPGIRETLNKVYELVTHPSDLAKNLPPADLITNEAGPKVGAKPADKATDKGEQPGDRPVEGEAKHGTVVRDKDQHVTKVDYPEGGSTTITYDKDHNPTELREADNSSWKKAEDGSGWQHFDKNGKPDQSADLDVKVNNGGDITITNKKDGYSETIGADGSVQARYVNASGPTFVQDGDRWSIQDKNGKEVSYFKGETQDKPNGDVVRKGVFGDTGEAETRTYHPDGKVTRDLRDGSSIETDQSKGVGKQIEALESQYKKELREERQGFYKKTYHDEIEASREAQYKKEYAKELRDQGVPFPESEKQAGEKAKEKIQTVKEQEDIQKEADRKTEKQLTADQQDINTKAEQKAREEVLKPDRAGELTHVKYPDGKTADFAHDSEGKLIEFKDRNGVTHTLENGTWNKYDVDKNGERTLRGAEEGSYQAKPNGDVVWTDKMGQVTETTHANGSRDRVEWKQDAKDHEHPENMQSQTSWDAKGRVTSATHGDKQVSFGYDKNGKLESVSEIYNGTRKEMQGMDTERWSKGKDGTWTKTERKEVDETQKNLDIVKKDLERDLANLEIKDSSGQPIKINTDDPNCVKELREAINAKLKLDPAQREELMRQVDSLETIKEKHVSTFPRVPSTNGDGSPVQARNVEVTPDGDVIVTYKSGTPATSDLKKANKIKGP